MARILRTPEAEESLHAIGRYIAEQSQSLDTAFHFLDKIDEACRLYSTQPQMGTSRPDLGRNLRCFTVDSYVVIYQPLHDGILVLLVIHGARDIPTVFRDFFGGSEKS